jgi:signal transduction histidine kinase
MTTLSILVIDAAIVVGFLAVMILGLEHREKPGAVPFLVLAGMLAAMTVGIAVARSGMVPQEWTDYALYVPFVFASLSWVALAFDYTGRGPAVTRRLAGGLAAFGVTVAFSPLLSVIVPDLLVPVTLLLINAMQFALIAAVGYGAVLVARSAIEYGDLTRSGSLVLSAVGTGLIAATVVLVLTPPLAFGTLFAVSEAILGSIAVLLLIVGVRYRIFETGATAGHLARESVLDEMSAAVAITGRRDRLLDINATAERTFDLDRPDALGTAIEDALGFDPDRETHPLTVETSEGRREFEPERSELTRQNGEQIGRAYILRDVTERRTHEQRLDVLNRVLRHNLRNDLDAVRGFAETLEREDAAVDDATLARQIRTTANGVADLGSTLSSADRLLEAEGLDLEPVELGAVLAGIEERVSEADPAASVQLSMEDSPITCRTDRQILETVVEEVVQNGVEHSDAGTPQVEIHARRGDEIVIEVRDDGPGIPERERAVLLDGEERPLRHGSGLGLWLVYWGVTRLGGTLAFREREPHGSVVSIRIPDRDTTPTRNRRSESSPVDDR